MPKTQAVQNIAKQVVERHDLAPPVQVEDLARQFSEFEYMPLPEELDGIVVYLKHPDCNTMILVNSEKPSVRKRFTLAHELGHVLIPWHIGAIASHTDGYEESADSTYRNMESEANTFASSLLLPERWSDEFISDHTEVIRMIQNAYSLGVSRTALCITLMSRLQPGWRYIEVDAQGIIIYSAQSEGSRFPFITRGKVFNSSAYVESRGDSETITILNGSNTIYITRMITELFRDEPSDLDWRSVLDSILAEVILDEKERRTTRNRITGSIGHEIGRQELTTPENLALRLSQRFLDRRDVPREVFIHPLFREFLLRKAYEYFERNK